MDKKLIYPWNSRLPFILLFTLSNHLLAVHSITRLSSPFCTAPWDYLLYILGFVMLTSFDNIIEDKWVRIRKEFNNVAWKNWHFYKKKVEAFTIFFHLMSWCLACTWKGPRQIATAFKKISNFGRHIEFCCFNFYLNKILLLLY